MSVYKNYFLKPTNGCCFFGYNFEINYRNNKSNHSANNAKKSTVLFEVTFHTLIINQRSPVA